MGTRLLNGFGSAGIAPDTKLNNDQAESLRDLAAAIAQAGNDENTDETNQEDDYMEIVEYVRLLTMNFYANKVQQTHKTSNHQSFTTH